MTCYHPLEAYRSLGSRTDKGKCPVVFTRPDGPSEPVTLPCGQCIGCRIERSRQWALRCVHEASLHDENCFVTLTYDDENLPPDRSLVKSDHQKFLKRLRAANPGVRIRYFLCGEYGDTEERPHYHALLFGFDFPDKIAWCKSKGHQIWISEDLQRLWPFGYSWIGEVTWESAAYVARYVMKKVNGAAALDRYVHDVDPDTGECRFQEPEYIAMSRRPGIGRDWYDKFKSDCAKDFLTHEGKKFKVPKYYDGVLELEDVQAFKRVKAKRKEVARANCVGSSRLAAMEKCAMRRVEQLKRSI